MSDLSHLVKAVRENLSKEDRRLLRAAYQPPDPEGYDILFDRVIERLRSHELFESPLPPRFT